MKLSSIKYKIFNALHNYPADVWVMWSILILTIIVFITQSYCYLTDNSELNNFILKL